MNLTNIGTIKKILDRYGFNFNKKFGQNFLVNPNVCPKIAEYGNAAAGWGILEIGPGIGVLTNELAIRADKVSAIEIDKRLMPILNETLAEFDNIKIYNDDVMKADLKCIIENDFVGLKTAVCANLPYCITSPVIMMLLESHLPIESITIMVQKEVAQRLCAKVGTKHSSAITVGVNYYGMIKQLFGVSRESFIPSPSVDAAVIKIDLIRTTKLDQKQEKFFFKMVKTGFSHRRKTLINSLKYIIDKTIVCSTLRNLGLSTSVRIETLDIDQLMALAMKLIDT